MALAKKCAVEADHHFKFISKRVIPRRWSNGAGDLEADRGSNNHVAGDSGFGRPVNRPTRFKDPLRSRPVRKQGVAGGDRRYGGIGNTALAVP